MPTRLHLASLICSHTSYRQITSVNLRDQKSLVVLEILAEELRIEVLFIVEETDIYNDHTVCSKILIHLIQISQVKSIFIYPRDFHQVTKIKNNKPH